MVCLYKERWFHITFGIKGKREFLECSNKMSAYLPARHLDVALVPARHPDAAPAYLPVQHLDITLGIVMGDTKIFNSIRY